MWQEEAAREAVPLFAHTHTNGSAFRDGVKSRVLGDAMKLWIQIQRSVVAYETDKQSLVKRKCFTLYLVLD